MTTILRIDSSSRPLARSWGAEGSFSRALASEIAARLSSDRPGARVIAPDLARQPIDLIVRLGHTFSYEGGRFRGLVADKPTDLVLSCGAPGCAPRGPLEPFDFLRPYLVPLMNFIGLTSVEVISMQGATAPDAAERLVDAKSAADASLAPTAA